MNDKKQPMVYAIQSFCSKSRFCRQRSISGCLGSLMDSLCVCVYILLFHFLAPTDHGTDAWVNRWMLSIVVEGTENNSNVMSTTKRLYALYRKQIATNAPRWSYKYRDRNTPVFHHDSKYIIMSSKFGRVTLSLLPLIFATTNKKR